MVSQKLTRRAFLTRAVALAGGMASVAILAGCGATPTPTAVPTKPAATAVPATKAAEATKPAATAAPAATTAPTVAPTKAPEPTKPPATTAPVAAKKRITISHTTGGSQAGSDKGYVWKLLRDKFPDLELVNQWVSYNAYLEKIPLLIASGDLADLQFCSAFTDVPLMMENKLLAETGTLINSVGKNILAVTPKIAWESTIYDNKQYAIAHNVYSLNIWNMAYRQDWLDKLSLKVPETLAQVEEVWKAFSTKDPDGNGKADTWGRQVYMNVRFDDDINHAYGVAIGHHFNGFWRKRKSGKLELDWVQPEMKEALGWWNKMWKAGYIHPESLTVPMGQRLKFFSAGVTGCGYTSFKEMDSQLTMIKGATPTAKLVAAAPPVGPGGQAMTGEGFPWVYVLSAKAKYPEDIVKVLDYTATPEFLSQTLCAGVPGVTRPANNAKGWCVEYTFDEVQKMGKEYTDKAATVAEQGDRGLWTPLSNTIESWVLPTLPADMRAHFEGILKTKYGPDAFLGIAIADKYAKMTEKQRPVPADRQYWKGLQTRFEEVVPQIVAGALDLEKGWTEWLAFTEKNGLPKITEEANKA